MAVWLKYLLELRDKGCYAPRDKGQAELDVTRNMITWRCGLRKIKSQS